VKEQSETTMELPLFPLNDVVLFPQMVLPLHIFELRYREMISRCIREELPFGVLLIDKGHEVGGEATPYLIGTTARIVRVEHLDDGRMNIVAVGGQRFRVLELHHDRSYLTGTVEPFPLVGGNSEIATELADKLRPRLHDYVELLGRSSGQQLKLDRLPDDAKMLALVVAIALQISSADRQALLSMPSVPAILARQLHLLSREMLLLQYMVETHDDMVAMSMGPTGYILPN
jgi:Lon protease-like protein